MKIPQLWCQNYIPRYRDREASGYFFVFYFVFSMYALISALPEERKRMLLIIVLCVYLTILLMPFYIEPRYSVALMPGIITLAGIGLGRFLLRLKLWVSHEG